jgi:hypothetical protein
MPRDEQRHFHLELVYADHARVALDRMLSLR